MKIKFRGVEKLLLDVVNRRSAAGKEGGRHTVFADLPLQPFKLFMAGDQIRVFEEGGHDRVILPFLDGVFGDPGDGDACFFHLLAVHRDGPHDSPGGVVFNGCASLFPVDADPHLWRKIDAEHLLPEGEDPQCPVGHCIRIRLVGKIRDTLVQGPPLGAADLIRALPPTPLRQGLGRGVSVVPEIQTRNIGDAVGHLTPDRFRDSFFVRHRGTPPFPPSRFAAV
ncbi:MAG: hypothetical protein ACYC5X_08070 [Syntrophales bacterium]